MSLTWQISDFDILNENPPKIKVGDEEIVVKELSIADFYYFIPEWQKLMVKFINIIISCEIDLKTLDDLNENNKVKLLSRVQNLMSFIKFRKEYITLLKRIRLFKMSITKFEKLCTPSQLAAIFVYLYRFNTDGVKKNFISLLGLVSTQKTSISEIFSTHSEKQGSLKPKTELKPRFRKLVR